MEIISWNVNGIRAISGKGLLKWLEKEQPDILCLQETKAHPEQLDEKIKNICGYVSYWNPAVRKGYSGVATYVKAEPDKVQTRTGIDILDAEGRILITFHGNFVLANVYFPNGQMNQQRLDYKLEFYRQIIKYLEELRISYPELLICGDFNTAHQAIDLKNPKSNEKRSGFLPVEREMLDIFLGKGYYDAFRYLYPEKVQYSWWDYRTRARERNAGWRIDCFYASHELLPMIEECIIMDDVYGSDHCPVALYLKE